MLDTIIFTLMVHGARVDKLINGSCMCWPKREDLNCIVSGPLHKVILTYKNKYFTGKYINEKSNVEIQCMYRKATK